MDEITPPPKPDDYPDRNLDCQFAMEPAFLALAHAARDAGWTDADISSALMELSATFMNAAMESRNTEGAIWASNTLNALRRKS